MEKHHNPSNFWFGFSLGAIVGAAGIYFFGTKSGRANMQKALELTEDLEKTVESVLGGVGEDYVEGLAGSEAVDRDRAETGKVVSEKESLVQSLLKTALEYLSTKQKERRFEVRHGKIVH